MSISRRAIAGTAATWKTLVRVKQGGINAPLRRQTSRAGRNIGDRRAAIDHRIRQPGPGKDSTRDRPTGRSLVHETILEFERLLPNEVAGEVIADVQIRTTVVEPEVVRIQLVRHRIEQRHRGVEEACGFIEGVAPGVT